MLTEKEDTAADRKALLTYLMQNGFTIEKVDEEKLADLLDKAGITVDPSKFDLEPDRGLTLEA